MIIHSCPGTYYAAYGWHVEVETSATHKPAQQGIMDCSRALLEAMYMDMTGRNELPRCNAGKVLIETNPG